MLYDPKDNNALYFSFRDNPKCSIVGEEEEEEEEDKALNVNDEVGAGAGIMNAFEKQVQ